MMSNSVDKIKPKCRKKRDLPMMFMKPPADRNDTETADVDDCVEDEDVSTQTEEGGLIFWPPGLFDKCKNRVPDRFAVAFGSTKKRHHQRQKRFDLPMMTGGVDRASEEEGTDDDLHVTCQFYEFITQTTSKIHSGKKSRKHKKQPN